MYSVESDDTDSEEEANVVRYTDLYKNIKEEKMEDRNAISKKKTWLSKKTLLHISNLSMKRGIIQKQYNRVCIE